MRVLIADKLSTVAVEELTSAGLDVSVQPTLKDDDLTVAMESFLPDVLVVRSTRVREEHFDAAPGLQLVVRAGAGVNTIDLAGASARAIWASASSSVFRI